MPREIIGQQGEVRIIKIDKLPANMTTIAVERANGMAIISHSESGHHHVLTGGDVMERTDKVPEGMKKFYAILSEPAALIQDASNAHGGYSLLAGFYEFVISRTYDAFSKQAKIVSD